ncbi:MAG: phosphate ABC transporter permease subunit PstC [Candidatus Magnetoovum sp. WYHC-5]|nr:phosphate ABC transporter permease subunit PstC [Candidatus Magnetoovum sp. WYHC-5]
MQITNILIIVTLLALTGFYCGKRLAGKQAKTSGVRLHSLPNYYGFYVALWCIIPASLILALWLMLEDKIVTKLVISDLPSEIKAVSYDRMSLIINDIKNVAVGHIADDSSRSEYVINAAVHYNRLKEISSMCIFGVILSCSIGGLTLGRRFISPLLPARNKVEFVVELLLIVCSTVAIFTTIGIVLSVLFEAIRFFKHVHILDFLFGLEWSPQMAIRADQIGAAGAFGIIPLLSGTLLISAISMCVAVPVGIMSAVYMSEYARPEFRATVKPLLEILAGIPTVVYGFFAALVVGPFLRTIGEAIGLDVASESALAAGLVMGVMIVPLISSLSDDVINAVPQSLRDASYAIGATKSETIIHVLLQAALPGIVGSVLLAVSRAIGETMIVVMAAGLTANLTANPLASVTTVTVQIVTLLIGDQEFDSPKTLAAFALGLVLFIITLLLNVIALYVVRKYREQYE